MNKETAKDQLLRLYESQIMDLTLMSKIELGDDVIEEILRLKEVINAQEVEYDGIVEQMKIEEQNLDNPQNPQLNIGVVSGSYIWLVEDCDGSCILSAHLTEEEAEKERELLRGGYGLWGNYRVYSVQIS